MGMIKVKAFGEFYKYHKLLQIINISRKYKAKCFLHFSENCKHSGSNFMRLNKDKHL